jgi:hypothetical protein
MDLEKLSNIFGADLVKEVYKDSLSKPVQEASEVLVDIVKSFRLFTAPIQLLASYQDRLKKYLETVRSRVPEEKQIPCPPNLAGPVLEELKYMEDKNILTELYLNLLTRGIDSERIAEAHPAFLIIIKQLSTDEARIIYNLKQGEYVFKQYLNIENYDLKRTLENNKPILEGLYFPEQISFYLNHLNSLNIFQHEVTYGAENEREYKHMTSTINFTITKTDFGEAFTKAVIPDIIKD